MDALPADAGADLDEVFRLLRHSRSSAARLEERRASLALRTADLTRSVSLAKGRLLLKPDVDLCLETMQAESAGRTVGSFETLLTAFVSEVLPQAKPIGLQLTTERGQPALDISSMSANGTAIDIFEDDGGALTNVVVSALRLLAVVKAKGAKFIALDEPDHWIKADRVPYFYHVFEEAARRLGIQCFAISHWDVRTFDTGMHISTIIGDPKDRCEIVSDKPAPEWPDEKAPGFRYVRLKNVQTLKDAEIGFGPGVNALTGDNGLGKSALVRVFRAAFYGETRDGLISLGERGMEVEFGWSDRRFLRFTREIRRNPKDQWSYHEEDGTLVSDEYHTGGRGVPTWVNEIFGLGRKGPIDIHISHQKKPLFLLEAAGSVRASILSVGREADYLADAMQIHKEQVKKDKDHVKDGERELASIAAALEGLSGVPGLAAEVERLDRELASTNGAIRETRVRRTSAESFATTSSALDAVRSVLARLSALPDRRDVDLLSEECRRRISEARLHDEGVRVRESLSAAASACLALATLPTSPPKISDVSPMRRAAEGLARLTTSLDRVEAEAGALASLPGVRPALSETAPMRNVLDDLRRLSTSLGIAKSEASALAALPKAAPFLADTSPSHALVAGTRRLSGEVAAMTALASAYATLPDAAPRLESTAPLRQASAQLAGRGAQLATTEAKIEVLERLPPPPATVDVEAMRLTAGSLAAASASSERASAYASVLAALPVPPLVGAASPLVSALSALKETGRDAEEAGRMATAARTREAAGRRRVDALLAAGGGRCPTCGQGVDADTLLSAAHPHH